MPIVFLAGIQNFQLNVSLFFPEFLKYILITDFKAFAFFVFDTNRFVLLINFAVDLSVTFFSVQYVLWKTLISGTEKNTKILWTG